MPAQNVILPRLKRDFKTSLNDDLFCDESMADSFECF